MNKFEDHWRKKMNEPGEYKDFLKEKARADIWEKVQAAKQGFEKTWQEKTGNMEAWEGALGEVAKQVLWNKLQIPLAPFERQWHEKLADTSQLQGLFLDEAAKERMKATVFAAKENFELNWQDKMNDPVLTGEDDRLNAASKERIWRNVQSANTNTKGPAAKEKRRPLFFLRWSHAAALLIGAFSAWLIWERSSVPLQNTLVVAPQSGIIAPAVNPVAMQKQTISSSQQETVSAERDAVSKPYTKLLVKGKVVAPAKENRGIIERVAGKVTPVKVVHAAVVQANAAPVLNTNNATASADKTNPGIQEPEIEVTTNKALPVKKVVHISDIRPADAPAKGTAIYGRAFREGKEKRNEKSTMTFNSVLKNYK
ncbi:MAG: hypothetical protein EOP54_03905 [Sphingobacteriales bacterium]|nr:MAG: hypothetical protein EOP54_03905 [Sphingobacteriales bacterium]